ncbi:MAG TPA: hypothetical protein VJN22_00090 [Candidatus Eremiobacteraceae bacterium]|nr:hypothetical protein [Candidatus Eremiobacteraceae bacterium]
MRNLAATGLAILIASQAAAIAAPASDVPFIGSDALLARYRVAIQVLKQPANMVVEYTQTRSGPTRVVTENHRLYRDGQGHERNEITAINGVPAIPAKVSIYTRSAWTYSADKFFVDPDLYQVALRGRLDVNGRKSVAYAAVMKDAGAFAVTDLELDPKTALPLRERFVAASPTCSATGSIDFGFSGGYWLPRIVSVTCPVVLSPDAAAAIPPTAAYRDTIRFSSYSFPAEIPAQVFGLPPTPAPGATSVPQR